MVILNAYSTIIFGDIHYYFCVCVYVFLFQLDLQVVVQQLVNNISCEFWQQKLFSNNVFCYSISSESNTHQKLLAADFFLCACVFYAPTNFHIE